jgi:hypothetical protein
MKSRPLTEIERGIYCRMRGELPAFSASPDYWAGWRMWDLWLNGIPGEFEA